MIFTACHFLLPSTAKYSGFNNESIFRIKNKVFATELYSKVPYRTNAIVNQPTGQPETTYLTKIFISNHLPVCQVKIIVFGHPSLSFVRNIPVSPPTHTVHLYKFK